MRGDEDTEVGYVEQPVNRLYRDGLAGQVAPYVVAVPQDADASGPVDRAAHGGPGWVGSFFGRCVGVDDIGGGLLHELEASDRGHVADCLVLPFEVVVHHPG